MSGELTFDVLGPADYERAKSVLNKAKHPGFVGRELFFRCATAGTVTVAVLDGQDVAVAMVASQKLQALSVVSSAQGSGVGARLIDRVQPRWASVIQERVPWFERRGYRSVGAPKVSQKGTTTTQLMERVGEPETREDKPSNVVALHKTEHAKETATESGRNVTALAAIWKQLEFAEKLTASLASRLQVTNKLMAEFGLTRRRARALQAAVAKRLRTDGILEDREQRIARYRLALESQAAAATAQGDPRTAVAALAVLVKLEGEPAAEAAAGLPYDASKPALVVSRQELSEAIAARQEQETG